jgi:hypothetical protein
MEKALEIMWKTHDTIGELIKFSDTKAGAILAINGVVLTIVFSEAIDSSNFIIKNKIVLSSLVLGFISGFISMGFSVLSLNPSLTSPQSSSLMYFGNIAENYDNYARYKIAVIAAISDDMAVMDQISEQVWIISKIALNKYRAVIWAIRFFIGVFIFLALAGIYTLYINI